MLRYHISPLDNDEIKDYINYRLRIAQATPAASGQIEFNDEAVDLISRFSGGTPRLINMICDRALLAGFVSETNKIDSRIIKRCTEELDSYSVNKAYEHH